MPHIPQPAGEEAPGAPSTPDRLLTPEDVSELLGIPIKTLANWRSERIGPRALTPDLGHADSSTVLGKREDPAHGQEELLRRVPSAGR